ncbi:hypothetical protein [Kitasatospora aureofaciens]|uniref:hypothetical protein n=1 Tax=Kitasatospora aureofaciens TaxID=1894 RepID=UPI000997FC32|nr:hypothetical protein [Kitasatospora aureofaciens]
MTRAQLTDAEWVLIEPYLPIGEYGPYPERLRQHGCTSRTRRVDGKLTEQQAALLDALRAA